LKALSISLWNLKSTFAGSEYKKGNTLIGISSKNTSTTLKKITGIEQLFLLRYTASERHPEEPSLKWGWPTTKISTLY